MNPNMPASPTTPKPDPNPTTFPSKEASTLTPVRESAGLSGYRDPYPHRMAGTNEATFPKYFSDPANPALAPKQINNAADETAARAAGLVQVTPAPSFEDRFGDSHPIASAVVFLLKQYATHADPVVTAQAAAHILSLQPAPVPVPVDHSQASPVGIQSISNPSGAAITLLMAGHPFANGDKVTAYGITGQTELNADWTAVVVDVDHIKLGGAIGNGVFSSEGSVNFTGASKSAAKPVPVTASTSTISPAPVVK